MYSKLLISFLSLILLCSCFKNILEQELTPNPLNGSISLDTGIITPDNFTFIDLTDTNISEDLKSKYKNFRTLLKQDDLKSSYEDVKYTTMFIELFKQNKLHILKTINISGNEINIIGVEKNKNYLDKETANISLSYDPEIGKKCGNFDLDPKWFDGCLVIIKNHNNSFIVSYGVLDTTHYQIIDDKYLITQETPGSCDYSVNISLYDSNLHLIEKITKNKNECSNKRETTYSKKGYTFKISEDSIIVLKNNNEVFSKKIIKGDDVIFNEKKNLLDNDKIIYAINGKSNILYLDTLSEKNKKADK